MRKAKSRKVHSRKVIMRVVKYTYNSQITGEGSESTLLVAFLYSPFVSFFSHVVKYAVFHYVRKKAGQRAWERG